MAEALLAAAEEAPYGPSPASLVALLALPLLAVGGLAYLALTSGSAPAPRLDSAPAEQGALDEPVQAEPEHAAPAEWPLEWTGELSEGLAQRALLLTVKTAHGDPELLKELATRGHPKAARIYGLGLVVGAENLGRDPQRGFGFVVHALRHGYVRAGGDLAPLFVEGDRLPSLLRVQGFGDHHLELGLPEDLELAAALAFLGTLYPGSARTANALLVRLRDELGIATPETRGEAYRIAQERLGSHPEVRALLASFEVSGQVGSETEGRGD